MKKKIVPLALALAFGNVCHSQIAGRVGVNTDSPTQTLDVHGTVRVSTLGTPNDNPHLVGWDPDNNQIVDMGVYSALKLFQKKHVEIPVDADRGTYHDAIGVENYDLGLDAGKYSIIATEPKLVYGAGDDPSKVAYIKAVAVADKDVFANRGRIRATSDNDWNNRITNVTNSTSDHNFLAANDGKHVLQGSIVRTVGKVHTSKDRNPILYEVPKVVFYKKDNRWKFTGKYYYSGPSNDGNTTYKWVFDMFIIDNSWVQYGRNIEMTIKNDSNGNPTIAEQKSNTRQAF